MRYMLLMSGTAAYWSALGTLGGADLRVHRAFLRDLGESLQESGELVANEGLAGPDQARIVCAHDPGAPVVTSAPFPPSRGFLAAYWLVDCDSTERALAIAARASAAPGRGGAPLNLPVEVRPVMRRPGEEM